MPQLYNVLMGNAMLNSDVEKDWLANILKAWIRISSYHRINNIRFISTL